MKKIIGYLLLSPILIIFAISMIIEIIENPYPSCISFCFVGLGFVGAYLIGTG